MKSWDEAALHSDASRVAPGAVEFAINGLAVTIIGSRNVARQPARQLFEQHLATLLHQRRTWLVGGARGVDQWAMEWLREHDETCWAVVPYTLRDQPRSALPLLEEVDRVVELQLPRRKTASAFRNRYMVELSQIVFGFWSGKGGGTIKTLRHALRKGREVHGVPVE